MPQGTETPKAGTFGWAIDLYTSGDKKWQDYSETTRNNRSAIYKRYRAAQEGRPLETITSEVIEKGLYAKGGHGAVNQYKALKPVFEHLQRLGFIPKNPLVGIELEKPKIKGFPVANATDIAAFKNTGLSEHGSGLFLILVFTLGPLALTYTNRPNN